MTDSRITAYLDSLGLKNSNPVEALIDSHRHLREKNKKIFETTRYLYNSRIGRFRIWLAKKILGGKAKEFL